MAGRSKEVSDETILREVLLSPDPVVTTSEIAGRVELTRQAVYNRFLELREEGYMRSKSVGSKSVVWWLTDDGKRKATEDRS